MEHWVGSLRAIQQALISYFIHSSMYMSTPISQFISPRNSNFWLYQLWAFLRPKDPCGVVLWLSVKSKYAIRIKYRKWYSMTSSCFYSFHDICTEVYNPFYYTSSFLKRQAHGEKEVSMPFFANPILTLVILLWDFQFELDDPQY